MEKTKEEIFVHQYLLNEGFEENDFGVISANFANGMGSMNLTFVITDVVKAYADQQTQSLQEENKRLREALESKDTKHQEELGNFNSIAAGDMEERYQREIEKIVTKLIEWRDFNIGMMGEGNARPATTAYDTAIRLLENISID
jgi:hypothetical protein